MNKRIYLSPPHMGGEEQKLVSEAFQSNWISPAGPHITAFENELAEYVSGKHCCALSSGTAAIHLALLVLGVKPDDEVLCSSFTFAGSCNPITYVGATPVFIDSEADTWNMDPALLRDAIGERIRKGKKPKAIIVVHLYGMPAHIDEIMDVAEKFDIPVIEDAAEALGSVFKGKKLGTWGHIGVFSFNGNKIITTSGGGALVSKNKNWIDESRFLATQARDNAIHYQHSRIGYNYRLSNICAAIGRGQLQVLDQRVQEKRSIFKYYLENLGPWKGKFLAEIKDGFSNRWLTTMLLPDQISPAIVVKRLEEENIECRPLWKPMHMQPVFEGAIAYQNGVSESLFNSGLCLPSGTTMTREQQDRVISFIKSVPTKE